MAGTHHPAGSLSAFCRFSRAVTATNDRGEPVGHRGRPPRGGVGSAGYQVAPAGSSMVVLMRLKKLVR
ncbi:hypothetical protein JW613_30960, partial [Streptomyces smyrnaeus]